MYDAAATLAPNNYALAVEIGRLLRAASAVSPRPRPRCAGPSASCPDQAPAYRVLAEQLIRQGRAREGHAVALEGLAHGGTDRELWALVSEAYVAKGDLEAAVRARRAALGWIPASSADWRGWPSLLDRAGAHRAGGQRRGRAPSRRTRPPPRRPATPPREAEGRREALGVASEEPAVRRGSRGRAGGSRLRQLAPQRVRLRRPAHHHGEHRDPRPGPSRTRSTQPYWPGAYGKQLGLWRPTTTGLLGLQYAVSGENPTLYHVVNVVAGHAAGLGAGGPPPGRADVAARGLRRRAGLRRAPRARGGGGQRHRHGRARARVPVPAGLPGPPARARAHGVGTGPGHRAAVRAWRSGARRAPSRCRA